MKRLMWGWGKVPSRRRQRGSANFKIFQQKVTHFSTFLSLPGQEIHFIFQHWKPLTSKQLYVARKNLFILYKFPTSWRFSIQRYLLPSIDTHSAFYRFLCVSDLTSFRAQPISCFDNPIKPWLSFLHFILAKILVKCKMKAFESINSHFKATQKRWI